MSTRDVVMVSEFYVTVEKHLAAARAYMECARIALRDGQATFADEMLEKAEHEHAAMLEDMRAANGVTR